MKIKDFIKMLDKMGYDDDTQLEFKVKGEIKNLYYDFYCQNIYDNRTSNAIGVYIDKTYK